MWCKKSHITSFHLVLGVIQNVEVTTSAGRTAMPTLLMRGLILSVIAASWRKKYSRIQANMLQIALKSSALIICADRTALMLSSSSLHLHAIFSPSGH